MNFNEQFSKREKIKSDGGIVGIIEVTPKNPKSSIPVFLSSGWAEAPDMLKGVIHSIFNKGYKVLACDYSHLDNTSDIDSKFPPNAHIKALSMLKIFTDKKINNINVVAHSEGAINVAIAAYLKPEIFNKIILVAPAGMTGGDTFYKLASRFSVSLFNEGDSNSISWVHIKNILRYIIYNPIQALAEAVGISNFKISTILKDLKKRGVEVHIIHGKNDKVFEMGKLKKMALSSNLKIHESSGGHNEIHNYPDRVINLVEEIL